MIRLRPYQADLIARARAEFRAGKRRVLCVSPTGSGKTLTSACMITGAVANGHRVLFAAGRIELVDQTLKALADVEIGSVRVIQADRDEGPRDASVIVGSIDTLIAREIPQVQFGVLDEAHHGAAATWSTLVKSQPEARWVGLTATPCRADGKPLGDVFDSLVLGPSVRELTDLGHLVPCTVLHGPPTLKANELARTPLERYLEFARGERAAVYCRDVKHAKAELEAFRAAGIPSEIITGTMAAGRRRSVLDAWRSGEILVVTSIGCLTEGFDLPALGVAILARRFNHIGQYLQVVGRVLRPAPGKTRALVVDLTHAAAEHGPPTVEHEYSLDGTAISKPARDSFGSCKECGAMFLYGPSQCPHCGAEIPTRPLPPPRAVNAELQELPAAKPRIPWVSALLSKYEGHCAKCGRWFPRGTPIYSTAGKRGSARHQMCPLPALPSAAVSP